MDAKYQEVMTTGHRRRRRATGSGGGAHHTQRVMWVLAAVVTLSAQFVGTLHVPVMLSLAIVLIGALAYSVWTGAVSSRLPLPALALALLAAYSLVQALPLPTLFYAAAGRGNVGIYSRLFEVLGEPTPSSLPLSLDAGASRIEAVKWAAYAIVFALAAGVGARGFPRSGPIIVHVSALLIALVTLGHRLASAQTVFGIYSPAGEFAKSSIGPLLNPNNLAGYLNLGIFCGLGLMLVRQPVWLRWMLPLSVALMVGVVVESRSRGGLVALGVGLVAMAPVAWKLLPELRRSRRGRRTLLGVGITVLAGGALAALAIAPDSVRQGADGGLKKLAMASWVVPLIRDYPWFGVGRGAFESAFQQYTVGPDNLIYSHPENFVVQWAAEWGVPCTALALLGLVRLLRPRAAGATENPVALGALAACAVLLLQNLVDLGTEVPAIVIAALVGLGTGWGAAEGQAKLLPRRRVYGSGLAAFAFVAWISVVAFPVETVGSARQRLDQRLEELPSRPDAAQLAGFRTELGSAMRAHPADPYFPRIAALLAYRQREPNALRWIGRALELGPTSGRSHLLLARMLAALGQGEQALLELRLAAAYDPGVAAHVAHVALGLTSRADQLQRAAPQGETGSRVLVAMAGELKEPPQAPLRVALLRAAVERAPDEPGPHRQLARLLLLELEKRDSVLCQGGERDACIRRVDEDARALERLDPMRSEGVELRARLLLIDGRAREASDLLKSRCDNFEERRSCLQSRLRAVLSAGDVSEMEKATLSLANQTCNSTDDCADLAGIIAETLSRAGRRHAALSYYVKAAQEDGKEKRWYRVAELASDLGQHGLAIQALTSVQARRARPDPKLQAKIELERSKLILSQ